MTRGISQAEAKAASPLLPASPLGGLKPGVVRGGSSGASGAAAPPAPRLPTLAANCCCHAEDRCCGRWRWPLLSARGQLPARLPTPPPRGALPPPAPAFPPVAFFPKGSLTRQYSDPRTSPRLAAAPALQNRPSLPSPRRGRPEGGPGSSALQRRGLLLPPGRPGPGWPPSTCLRDSPGRGSLPSGLRLQQSSCVPRGDGDGASPRSVGTAVREPAAGCAPRVAACVCPCVCGRTCVRCEASAPACSPSFLSALPCRCGRAVGAEESLAPREQQPTPGESSVAPGSPRPSRGKGVGEHGQERPGLPLPFDPSRSDSPRSSSAAHLAPSSPAQAGHRQPLWAWLPHSRPSMAWPQAGKREDGQGRP